MSTVLGSFRRCLIPGSPWEGRLLRFPFFLGELFARFSLAAEASRDSLLGFLVGLKLIYVIKSSTGYKVPMYSMQ